MEKKQLLHTKHITGKIYHYQDTTKQLIFTDDQRQLLWLYAENKGVKWVKGFEVIGANTVNKDYYERLLKEKNENGISLHGDDIKEIERKGIKTLMQNTVYSPQSEIIVP